MAGGQNVMNWSGVFPAVTTKIRADESLDLEATQASLAGAIDPGVNGIVMVGMLGENGMMTAAEKERVVRAAKEVVAGRVPLLSGLAETTTRDAGAYARGGES